jgi:hypothetical protein
MLVITSGYMQPLVIVVKPLVQSWHSPTAGAQWFRTRPVAPWLLLGVGSFLTGYAIFILCTRDVAAVARLVISEVAENVMSGCF